MSKIFDSIFIGVLNLAFGLQKSGNPFLNECRRRERNGLIFMGFACLCYGLMWVTTPNSVDNASVVPLWQVVFWIQKGLFFAGLLAYLTGLYWFYRRIRIHAEIGNGIFEIH